MDRSNHTPHLAPTEEALTVLFCLIDCAYRRLNPHARRQESLKRLSDSELIVGAKLGYRIARRLLADLAYYSGELREALAEMGILS